MLGEGLLAEERLAFGLKFPKLMPGVGVVGRETLALERSHELVERVLHDAAQLVPELVAQFSDRYEDVAELALGIGDVSLDLQTEPRLRAAEQPDRVARGARRRPELAHVRLREERHLDRLLAAHRDEVVEVAHNLVQRPEWADDARRRRTGPRREFGLELLADLAHDLGDVPGLAARPLHRLDGLVLGLDRPGDRDHGLDGRRHASFLRPRRIRLGRALFFLALSFLSAGLHRPVTGLHRPVTPSRGHTAAYASFSPSG
mmetsp:Transcript_9961/g.40404  ORF Transcript_9961/g.40404 Transcript_9961/m.40404 type:complete len:260 (-) Transcript_9961:8-787(-)